MAKKGDAARTPLTTAGLIAPIITLALLILFWRLGHKWLAIPVVVAVTLFYLLLPRLVRSRLTRFHKEALLLISSGRSAEVPGLARRNLLLQIFAPSPPIDAKIGLALVQIGDHARAIPHLENAIPSAPASERPALQAALVRSLFVIGDPARSETEGLALLDTGLRLPEVLVATARSRIGLSRLDDHTRALLDEAERFASSPDLRLMVSLSRIELALLAGRKPEDLPADADSSQRFVRTWIHLVRGQLREHRGDSEGAAESYGKAAREGGEQYCWFSGLAHERLSKLSLSLSPNSPGTPSKDTDEASALRRRRKKKH